MSDGDDDFMCDEEEDYGLEYSEDSNSEPDVDLENQYYNSKALNEDEPRAALSSFQKVLDLEGGEALQFLVDFLKFLQLNITTHKMMCNLNQIYMNEIT